jgi:hypothetical protein
MPGSGVADTAILVSPDFGAPDYAENLEEIRLLAGSVLQRNASLVIFDHDLSPAQ